jgi:hypothetical protein
MGEMLIGFWRGDFGKIIGVDGKITLKWFFRKWGGSIVWIDVARERYRWRALVSAVMNIRVR